MKKLKRVVLHFGVPKTGTTSLQTHLWNHVDTLHKHGIAFPPRLVSSNNVDPFYACFSNVGESPDIRNKLNRIAKERLTEIFENHRVVLLSHESILGNPFDKQQFFPLLDIMAERLANTFQGYDIGLVVCIRRQDELLQSYYSQTLRTGGSEPFAEFIETRSTQDMAWQNYLKRIQSAFGSVKSRVIHYDALASGVDEVQNACLELATIDCGGMVLDIPHNERRMNPSFRSSRYDLPRRINLVSERLQLPRKNRIRRYLVEISGRWGPSRADGGQPEKYLYSLRQKYAGENEVILANSGAEISTMISALEKVQ
jgi:hypothetical protein